MTTKNTINGSLNKKIALYKLRNSFAKNSEDNFVEEVSKLYFTYGTHQTDTNEHYCR